MHIFLPIDSVEEASIYRIEDKKHLDDLIEHLGHDIGCGCRG